ncbi:transposase [Clostridium septicum]|uniref:transposase n=1 Tax=Clostridium septicum TaxID=1504 RepID=UPI001FA9E988|nr:transposase [Clostridium septicum]
MYTKNKYIYDYDKDIYICPNNVALIYKTTTREGYREYRCFEEICMYCPHKDKCLGEKAKYKTIRRHVWENHKDDNKNFLKTEKEREFTIEEKKQLSEASQIQKFAWASLCSLPRTRKVSEQCLLTAAVQNMKR